MLITLRNDEVAPKEHYLEQNHPGQLILLSKLPPPKTSEIGKPLPTRCTVIKGLRKF